MQILFFNPQGNFDEAGSHLTEHPDFGGQLVYVKELAMAMVDAGHRADIITRRIVDPQWPEFAAETDHYSGYGPELRIVRIPCGGDAFLAKEQLWEHIPEFVSGTLDFYSGTLPDFATAHYADGGYCAALLQNETGLPFTFTGHSLGAQKMDKLGMNHENRMEMERQFRFSKRISAERLAMKRAFRIITSTAQERDEQYSHPLYSGAVDAKDVSRFSVVPPGVNTRVFSSKPAAIDPEVQSRLNHQLAKPNRPHLLVSSRIDEKKNIIGTVAAYTASRELQDKAGLVICVRGIDDPFEEIERLSSAEQEVLRPILDAIAVAGLRGKVDFLNVGSQAELAATYRFFAARQSVFVLTAIYEPFGLAPIEAAACGLACVATRNGGPSEIFSDDSGMLVNPFDQDDITGGMLKALENYSALADRSARRVREKYTWDRTAAGYLNAIRQGLDTSRRRAAPVQLTSQETRISEYLA